MQLGDYYEYSYFFCYIDYFIIVYIIKICLFYVYGIKIEIWLK